MSSKLRNAVRGLANARGIDGEVFQELMGLITGTITGAEHRALAIVGGALLEDALRDAISTHLNPERKEESDIFLFEDEHAPLNGLASRTRMGISLGIIDDVTKKDIDTLRSIRIAFAHSPTRITFEHRDITKLLDVLNGLALLVPGSLDDLRALAPANFNAGRFAVAVTLLCGAISLHVPFWLPHREIAKALKAASLNIPVQPDPQDQAD